MSDDQEEVVDRKSDASSAKSIKSSIDGGAADRAAEETDKQAAMVALDQADQSIDQSQSNLTAANDDNSIATGCAFVTIPPPAAAITKTESEVVREMAGSSTALPDLRLGEAGNRAERTAGYLLTEQLAYSKKNDNANIKTSKDPQDPDVDVQPVTKKVAGVAAKTVSPRPKPASRPPIEQDSLWDDLGTLNPALEAQQQARTEAWARASQAGAGRRSPTAAEILAEASKELQKRASMSSRSTTLHKQTNV